MRSDQCLHATQKPNAACEGQTTELAHDPLLFTLGLTRTGHKLPNDVLKYTDNDRCVVCALAIHCDALEEVQGQGYEPVVSHPLLNVLWLLPFDAGADRDLVPSSFRFCSLRGVLGHA